MGRRHENSDAAQVRVQINYAMPEIVRSCTLIGHPLTMFYNSPQHGASTHVNLITNLFGLDRLRIPASKAFDLLNQAIGDYERLRAKLKRQSWNPFYWVRLAFFVALSIPFRILGAAGFDGRAVEQSLIGRLFKAAEGFVFFLAALLTAAQLLGFSTSLRHLADLFRHR
jgi:hypothetical protein